MQRASSKGVEPTRETSMANQSQRHPTHTQTDNHQDLTMAEIEARMETDGFPELRWLWERFKRSGCALVDIDGDLNTRLRDKHMGALISHPFIMLAVSVGVAIYMFGNLGSSLGLGSSSSAFDRTMQGLFATLSVYLFWFAITVFQRTFIHPWKTIASTDLAAMLKRRSYREWLNATEEAQQVTMRLRELGVNELWDNSEYRIWINAVSGEFEVVERMSSADYVQKALREVLGNKEDRTFQPGRFYDNLKSRKKSVTRFVTLQQEALAASREGNLTVADGLSLLKHLKKTEMVPDSAGAKYLEGVIDALGAKDFLPKGVVVAAIWKRDPWVDLTRAEDFFSSASLRGNSFMDSLERRSKGMIGPFGYLRNKSISALDFKTSAGRSVRARLAAATMRNQEGVERPVLFVDAVEGRFEIKPALVRRAVDDYARAAGFDRVFYHSFPLNRVPMRFVSHLADSDARLEELDITYVNATRREYLDAFGLPVEPFEYAYPKGKVIGYSIDTGGWPSADPVVPGIGKLALYRVKDKSILWIMLFSSFACLSWVLYRLNPQWLLPAVALCALAVAYELVIAPKFKRKIAAEEEITEDKKEHLPGFVQQILAEIGQTEMAIKMSYPDRLHPKVNKLLEYFEHPSARLAPFFEVILFNTSIKETHIENAIKFMKKLDASDRQKIATLFELLWPQRNEAILKVGLSEDKQARVEAMTATMTRIDRIREYVKGVPREGWNAKLLRKVGKVLQIAHEDVLEVVRLRPRILRGLKKPPRPIYAWIGPTAVALGMVYLLVTQIPNVAPIAVYVVMMGVSVLGTWVVSTRLAIAPGILCYEKTRRRLKEVLKGGWTRSPVSLRMSDLGLEVEEYARNQLYENKDKGIRIEIPDKRTLEGAMQFLTSSEEIGNCIALRNFVSWCLPSLLNDETIMLADVLLKGSSRAWHQRAQLWMVAAQRKGEPVLAVNSVEFNNEGAKHIDVLLPEMIEIMRDVCRRAGFRGIYVGISDFGRHWFEEHFPQGDVPDPIIKVHHPDLGFTYYFDAFNLKRSGILGKRYEYMKKRSLVARTYAVVFGLIERLKGNSAKAKAFFDSAI